MADLPSLVVEAAVGVAPAVAYLQLDDPSRGLLDTGVLGPDTVWTDISAYARSFTTTRGRNRATESYTPGRCSVVLDNTDGRFDPENLSGPYVFESVTQLKSMVPIRLSAVYAGVSYPLFRGYSDAWATSHPGMFDSVCVLTATDAFKTLGFQASSASAPVGEGEGTGARIARLLNIAGFSAVDRDLDTGLNTVQATTLAQAVLTEMQLTADSEYADLFISSDGKVTFRERYARLTRSRSITSQVTFSDDKTAVDAGTAIGYTDIRKESDGDLIGNDVTRANAGSTLQTVTDATSIANFLPRRDNKTDLVNDTDSHALSVAQWLLLLYKDYEVRVAKIDVMPASASTFAWPVMLALEFLDRVSVERRPPYGGTLTTPSFVQGIDWEGGPENWTVSLALEGAANQTGYFVLDSATLGVLDTNYLTA